MASVSLSSFWIFKAGGLVTDADSATWRVTTPGPADTITWNIGPNTLDGLAFALVTATEPKFNFNAAGTPVVRTLVGLAATQVGAAAGTTAVSTGTGASAPVAGTLFGTNYRCSWNLSLTVTPGTPRAAVSYATGMDADDPIRLDRRVFDDNAAGRTSLYIPVALDGLNHAPDGGGGMSVSYVTDAGTVELLNLQSAGGQVSAQSSQPGLARYYLVDHPNRNPMALGERPYSLSNLRDLLAARMKGGVLGQPLLIGVLLENIPVPTVEIGPAGTVAEVHVASRLFETVPASPGKPGKPGKPYDPAPYGPYRC